MPTLTKKQTESSIKSIWSQSPGALPQIISRKDQEGTLMTEQTLMTEPWRHPNQTTEKLLCLITDSQMMCNIAADGKYIGH